MLEFLSTILDKRNTQTRCFSTAHTDELAKLFVAAVRHMKTRELKETAATLLEQFIDVHKKQLNMETLLEEAGECEHLRPLRQQFINDPKLPKVGESGAVDYIRAFLKPNRLERLHGLREYVSNRDKEFSNRFIMLILFCAACRAQECAAITRAAAVRADQSPHTHGARVTQTGRQSGCAQMSSTDWTTENAAHIVLFSNRLRCL